MPSLFSHSTSKKDLAGLVCFGLKNIGEVKTFTTFATKKNI
jgi:hypothetical protein